MYQHAKLSLFRRLLGVNTFAKEWATILMGHRSTRVYQSSTRRKNAINSRKSNWPCLSWRRVEWFAFCITFRRISFLLGGQCMCRFISENDLWKLCKCGQRPTACPTSTNICIICSSATLGAWFISCKTRSKEALDVFKPHLCSWTYGSYGSYGSYGVMKIRPAITTHHNHPQPSSQPSRSSHGIVVA